MLEIELDNILWPILGTILCLIVYKQVTIRLHSKESDGYLPTQEEIRFKLLFNLKS